ncbi:MAG: hypothetical protein AAGF07_02460 [Patescibacteria group bacterium]
MPSYKLHLPDKSKYLELVPTPQEVLELPKQINNMLAEASNYDSRRILIKEIQIPALLQATSNNQSQRLTLRETVVFKCGLEDLCKQIKADESLEISQIDLNSKHLPIFLDFMLSSFGVDFTDDRGVVENKDKTKLLKSRFEDAFKDVKNKHFLASLNGNYIGTFSLVFLNEVKQIQLHSVAGRASHSLNLYKKSNKFELLTRVIKCTLKNNSEGYSDLVFTCSKPKVVELYKKHGFSPDNSIKVFKLT